MHQIIAKAKKKHHDIYGTQINEVFFVWRPLARDEYENVQAASVGKEQFHLNLCQAGVIFPEFQDYNECPAGWVDALAPLIIEKSGYGTEEFNKAALERHRKQMDNFVAQAETLVMIAFPGVRPHEIGRWTADELWEMVARAEWALKLQGVKVNLEFTDREKPDKKEMASEMYLQGIDPMSTVDPESLRFDKGFVEFPFIFGLNWDNEEIANAVSRILSKTHAEPDPVPAVPGGSAGLLVRRPGPDRTGQNPGDPGRPDRRRPGAAPGIPGGNPQKRR